MNRADVKATRTRVPGSFRDPAGFLFARDGTLFRQVNRSYSASYDRLLSSGLYESLVNDGLLIPHREAGIELAESEDAYRVIQPDRVAFVSHPFEWSFSQLKDAALTTLRIQRRALSFGMSLKDASAYNVQLHAGSPVLIDTLSFQILEAEFPWIAYRQFCQHFLAPLALMAHVDVRLVELLKSHMDGIPLDLAAELLPLRTRIKPGLAMHVHLHAGSQRRHSSGSLTREQFRGRMSLHKHVALAQSLESAVRGLRWNPASTSWAEYSGQDSYDGTGFTHKKGLVADYLSRLKPEEVWDLGSNTGTFSRIASDQGSRVVAIDGDPGAVDLNYREVVSKHEPRIYPIVADLTNPSPPLGWENRERSSLLERGPGDAVLALSLVHHLAISNNLPLDMLAGFFSRLGKALIVEFVPAGDARAARLLAMRDHSFPGYTTEAFEAAFAKLYRIEAKETIEGSERALYLMTVRETAAA